ncbi:hypothetical protein PDIG_11070 [Penicillium digitatum PHI26]|uniref:Uncharacterized protein n=2 Tax=Penicillium digitatum TaxID=36651 RepID=K9GAN9_PEND2|nr:hypothetical protein PDIP_82580 [Penicillium digitatum Pd1]EKV05578.1 hypothetical protein PDIP_82580 [Penicillium digitatum Pd1]EKV18159.1 hypothetical protein PDIG_11070 [Penicillium digitatum PHI26]
MTRSPSSILVTPGLERILMILNGGNGIMLRNSFQNLLQ